MGCIQQGRAIVVQPYSAEFETRQKQTLFMPASRAADQVNVILAYVGTWLCMCSLAKELWVLM